MIYDFYAEQYGKDVPDDWRPYTRIKLTKIGNRRRYRHHMEIYTQNEITCARNMLKGLAILQSGFKLDKLPKYSFTIKLTFKLRESYISADDEGLYPEHNPICKDKVFKAPYIRPSSWKGNLRFATLKRFEERIFKGEINDSNWKDERAILLRLFGNKKDKMNFHIDELITKYIYRNEKSSEDIEREFEKYIIDKKYVGKEGFRQGRLVFYPTFLDKIDLDVITPLRRDTRTPARGPIIFEIAPGRRINEKGEIKESAKGDFSLLYVPFDLVGTEEKIVREEVREDLKVLKEAISAMLIKYGFGAKTTTGYGVVKKEIEFQILPKMKEKKNDENFGEDNSIFMQEMNELIKNYGEKA